MCAAQAILQPTPTQRRSRTVGRLLKVNVGVSQRPARDDVPTHSDGHDWPGGRELLVEHGLGDVWMEVAHVQRRQRIRRAAAVHGGRRLDWDGEGVSF